MSLLNIGMSGLSAASSSLAVTGNNIANVDTAGYSRQQTVQSSKASIQYGNVFIGTGTTLADVRRVYNAYLDKQLQLTTSLSSDAQAYLSQVTQVDKLLSDSGTGITKVMQSFFSSLQTLSSTPNDAAARQALLTNSQSLSSRFNAMSDQLKQQGSYINAQMGSMVDQVNKLASTIATYNQKITAANGTGSAPNDLMDQRNETVRQLSQLVGTQVVERDGSYDIYMTGGQPLVMGSTANSLQVSTDKSDPTRSSIIMNRGFSTLDITSAVTGGEMGGLLRYRDDVLAPATNALGRIAMVVSDQVNRQLGQGLDQNGEFGAALFSNINSATAISQRSIASSNNNPASGNLNVTIQDTSKLSTSDYQVTFTSATGYSVKRLSDNTDMGSFTLGASPAPVIDGFSLSLNSAAGVSAGDNFKITPTRSGAGDLSTVMTDTKRLSTSAPLTSTLAQGNKGTGSVSQPTLTSTLDIYNPVQSQDMQNAIKTAMPVRMLMTSANAYEVLDAKGNSLGTGSIVPGQSNKLSIPVPYTDSLGAAQNFNFEMTVSGNPVSGDSFNVSMTAASSTDNRNAQALLGLQSKATVGATTTSPGVSFSDAYGGLVSEVGAKAKQGQMDGTANDTLLKGAAAARDSLSGVDLDEETGHLVKFQQYYSASSQIIKAAQEIFSTLINSL
ncbi:flagellar hook-associated protein FlgK [Pseudomonas sp. FW306-02-F02-AA]|uniref:Flagellar hook-associated protein 1 n=1 Tax=Pseudomonas fluorescens TaxID=294 RepID=A0A0N9WIF4_PSEFL|nr:MULTISPECIES: flagellar hook-associated protein FlgK [Pseudomonas]ALI02993.1 flagellar biosynthesis protein FlgK [Pseudomonas fluorescens]PMZ04152.1 flagellar hook-associated protein FlgK [Pseudomonas sp. FW306-02-F02-AB]PMZ10307.1 flagellar hook-associated protein FlgK [Pseudomonas sp. FW306-02-H06C]PMZ15734.1 flagellar hook-associated protein FlgK [Pseudomonas sp. FW306-02-F02-AA]PMZ20911.1 flagellar hook-associated protein FlgK [Pseudomonas sp. FW306-02-F08-AA]